MPRGKPYARIAITLPADDLAAADRLAEVQDRSRSWIVAEAVRRYVAEQAALDPARREQLRRDLTLTAQERIRAAEDGVRFKGPAHGLVAEEPLRFPTFDAFLAWLDTQPKRT